MKKIKEIEAGNLYVFQGKCSASSSMFRNLEEAQYFLAKANKRFAGYLIIKDFVLQQEGWTLLCQIERENSIRIAYADARKRSKKAKAACLLTETWRIVSEQFRHFLSQYVKYVNKLENRSGVLVHSSFERFYFESLTEAEEYIEVIREQEIDLGQKTPKHGVLSRHWNIKEGETCGSVFLCSKDQEGFRKKFGAWGKGSFDLEWLKTPDVLRQLVKKTISIHFQKNLHQKIE